MPHDHAVTTAKDSQTSDVRGKDNSPENPEGEDHDMMGPSVLNNLEIDMVYVLPVKFQPTTSQPNFLDDDMVAEEATHVEFMATEEVEPMSKEDKLKTASTKFFPHFSPVILHHLKLL
ncbi:hypothetical protein PS2_029377 [Malus domestica]